MKKNILGACVIIILTIAILLMIDDLKNQENKENAQIFEQYQPATQEEFATSDLDQ